MRHLHLVREDGSIVLDVPCPIGCGKCCKYWRDVDELKYLAEAKPKRVRCPNLRENGCKLKRSRRPAECNNYVCELGALAVTGRVTIEDAERVLEAGKQEDAFEFLGKEKPTRYLKDEAEAGRVFLRDEDKKRVLPMDGRNE